MKLRVPSTEYRVKAAALAGLVACALLLTGCPPIQQIARDSIAGGKGVIEAAQIEYGPQCTANPMLSDCVLINRAIAGQNLAIDALHIYCASDSYENGGPCTPNKEFEPKLRQALESFERIVAEVRQLLKKPAPAPVSDERDCLVPQRGSNLCSDYQAVTQKRDALTGVSTGGRR